MSWPWRRAPRAPFVFLALALLGARSASSAAPAAAPPPTAGSVRWAHGSAHAGGDFELLTYNVAGLPEGISRSRPAAYLPRIGQLLNRYDIALVQEDFAYPGELRREIRLAYTSPPFVRAGLDFGDGLSQFSRFPFALRREPWQRCSGVVDAFFDCLTPKGFSLAVQELLPGARVHVYNLHMDAGFLPEDRAAREAQIEQLVAAIARDSAGEAVIVAGDTNLARRDRDLLARLLEGASLRDACADTGCPEPGRVDRVLYRSSASLRLSPLRWRVAPEFVSDEARPLSDHRAVAVRFDWRWAPAP